MFLEKKLPLLELPTERETTVVWNRETSEPIYNAIVWQDRRTAKYCDQLKSEGKAQLIKEKQV